MLLAVEDVCLGYGVVFLIHQLGLYDVLKFLNFEGVVVIEHIDEMLESFYETDGGLLISTRLESGLYGYFYLAEIKRLDFAVSFDYIHIGYGFFALKFGLGFKVTTSFPILEELFLNKKNVVFNNVALTYIKLDISNNYVYF